MTVHHLPAHLHHRHTDAKFRVVCGVGFFGVKMNGNPCYAKHKQLRSSGKSTQNKKKFIRNLLFKTGKNLATYQECFTLSHNNMIVCFCSKKVSQSYPIDLPLHIPTVKQITNDNPEKMVKTKQNNLKSAHVFSSLPPLNYNQTLTETSRLCDLTSPLFLLFISPA